MSELITVIMSKLNYWVYIVLMMIGLYAMILQTAVILFFISLGVKKEATIPIIMHGSATGSHAIQASDYMNPLPHVLMLTAIVVAVATLGVALALVIKVYQQYQTLEEDEILVQLEDA
ncbi:MAG: cation:proton antiporter subunit C [Desulfobacterales bacterium]